MEKDPTVKVMMISGGGGGSVTVDDKFSLVSENPVQNKVITQRVNTLTAGVSSAQATAQRADGLANSNQQRIADAEADIYFIKSQLGTGYTKIVDNSIVSSYTKGSI